MRLYLFLIISVVSMAFMTGYYALFMQESYTATDRDIAEIEQIKRQFRRSHRPLERINFSSVYLTDEHYKLLENINYLERREEQIQRGAEIYSSSRQCFEDVKEFLNSNNYHKVLLWEEFRCGRRKSLSRLFFSQPPYIHPSGNSYAYLAYLSDIPPFDRKSWIVHLLPFFHISELHEVQENYGRLPGLFHYLGTVGKDMTWAFSTAQKMVVSDDYVFMKNNNLYNLFELEYNVYSRATFERFLRTTSYHIEDFKRNQSCFYQDGGVCWEYDIRHVFSMVSRGSLLFFLVCIVSIGLILWILLNRLKLQRIEDDRRRLALQVLTHEFRTPVASMLVNIENLINKSEKFDESEQAEVLRLSSDVHRLHRLTEASRNYLRLHNDKGLVALNRKEVESVNQSIEIMLDPYLDEVKFHPLENDRSFPLDEYWLGICVKNLVENALVHGEKPITVSLASKNDTFIIIVEDQGKCDFCTLEDLTRAFVRGQKSSGTGLGLNIVKKVVEEMGGSLEFSSNPTQFRIVLKKG